MALKSQQEIYDLFIREAQSLRPDLTDASVGSILDLLAGICSTAVAEINALTVAELAKTYFDTANGPEITGGADELERLAVDHFGSDFARPAATNAIGTVLFSRPSSTPGPCLIPAGTIVKTAKNAAGNSQRYQTVADVTMVGTAISASVVALDPGPAGNAADGTVTVVETTLTDTTIVVTNTTAFSGGADRLGDSDYRERIRNLIESLTGSTLRAIEAKAKTVAGVVTATGIEKLLAVIEYNIATGLPVGGAKYFYLPSATLYVADANGSANDALVALVKAAIDQVDSAGVEVQVVGATPLSLNWTAAITLNPSGPNYAVLVSDPTMIEDAMKAYVNDLGIGSGFDKTAANNQILALFGPSGTNDITAITTSVPSGNVAATATEKLVAGTVEVA